MPEETRRGRATKDAFAQSFMDRLEAGEELASISVRSLANDCNVDRQTFYYHFKNLHALAEYAYEREIEKLLGAKELGEFESTDWKSKARVVLTAVNRSHALKENTSPLIDEGLLWSSIARRIEASLHRDLDEQLRSYNVDESTRESSIKCLGYAIASIYVAWSRQEIAGTLDDTLDVIEHMRNDFLAGMKARHLR